MATRTTRRPTHPTAPTANRPPVEDLLRELAYVMHVTRKVTRQVVWPATPRVRTAEDARVTASA